MRLGLKGNAMKGTITSCAEIGAGLPQATKINEIIKVTITIFFLALWALPSRSSDDVLQLDNLKNALRSDSVKPEKKLAAIRLYLKAKGKLSSEDLEFFKKAFLTPSFCESREILQCLGTILLNSEKVDKKTLDKELLEAIRRSADKKYSLWGLEFYISHPTLEKGKVDNAATMFIERNKYAADIAKQNNYSIFIEAIKQRSTIASSSSTLDAFIFPNNQDISKFLDATLSDTLKTHSPELLEYIHRVTAFSAHITTHQADAIAKIASDTSQPKTNRDWASSILSQVFFIPPPPLEWKKWIAENADTFDRKDAAEKALESKKLDDNVKTAALKHLLKISKGRIDKKFAEKLKHTAENSNSPELCATIAGALYKAFANGNIDKSLEPLSNSIWKTCYEVCSKHKTKPGEPHYVIPQKMPKPQPDDAPPAPSGGKKNASKQRGAIK